MCLDRLGIERVPEVMSAGLCVLDHNKVKSDFEEGKVLDLCTGKNGICSKSFYCSYLFFCRQRHKKLGMLCSITTNVGEKNDCLSHWLFYTLYLLLVWVLCKLQFNFFFFPALSCSTKWKFTVFCIKGHVCTQLQLWPPRSRPAKQ